jgi:hypothetical protein
VIYEDVATTLRMRRGMFDPVKGGTTIRTSGEAATLGWKVQSTRGATTNINDEASTTKVKSRINATV